MIRSMRPAWRSGTSQGGRIFSLLQLRYLFVVFRKTESHSGQFLNERADDLADCGASGIFRYRLMFIAGRTRGAKMWRLG
eukprot:305407-Pyramimonas_sp.AAC.1